MTNMSLLWELNGAQSLNSADWKKGVLPITGLKNDYIIVIEGNTIDGDIRYHNNFYIFFKTTYNKLMIFFSNFSIDDIAFLDYSNSCLLEPSFSLPTTTIKPITTTPSIYGFRIKFYFRFILFNFNFNSRWI